MIIKANYFVKLKDIATSSHLHISASFFSDFIKRSRFTSRFSRSIDSDNNLPDTVNSEY